MKALFNDGDKVDVKERSDLDYCGTIVKIADGKALVRFKFVRHPEGRGRGVCENCGFPGSFSVNGGTGEIVCMRSGCGHGYGFVEREEIIALEKLINITEQTKQEKKQERISEIKSRINAAKRGLEIAVQGGIITENEKMDLLKALN